MENDNSFSEKKVIGNNAESIVEFLINSSPNWKCIRFGVENLMSELKKTLRKENNSTAEQIRYMPDFVAHNKKTGETLFVEAKFRGFIDNRIPGKSEYKLDFLERYKNYWSNTKLIVVHPSDPYFFVINLDDINQSMCRRERAGQSKWDYYWNFADIQKSIKDLFPDLSDEIIQKAIDMIPKKNGNN